MPPGCRPTFRLSALTEDGRLPFVFEASGRETHFTNGYDPDARARRVFNGANVKDVQRMLGHASATMTLDVNAGLFEDGLDRVADRMDALARSAADSLRTGSQVVGLPSSVSAGEAGWGSRGLNPGPTDYESAALTG